MKPINFHDDTQGMGITITTNKNTAHKHTYHYKLGEQEAWALNTAIAIHRPLLIVGEPGIGKSQLALAAAHKIKTQLITTVVRSTTDVEQLLWQYDAVGRLANAQIASMMQASPQGLESDKKPDTKAQLEKELHYSRFLTPGPIWQAFDPLSAETYPRASANQVFSEWEIPESLPAENPKAPRCVLLIDEIDKADADLPNGLLDIIDQQRFDCPYLDVRDKIVYVRGQRKPLIIFTSNKERELPPAFVRRCVVLKITMGEKREQWRDFLQERAKSHFSLRENSLFSHKGLNEENNQNLFEEALERFLSDREAAIHTDIIPGLAEFLDLLNALDDLALTQGVESAKQALRFIAESISRKAVHMQLGF